ncbi:MAG: hypothetical protein HYX53_18730 [Chloroflexi bacterium]|nr:hypothetical protein [Chloroflexota bacterium]
MARLRKDHDDSEHGAGQAPGESGQGLAEYGLILALIAVVAIAALGSLGQAIVDSPGWAMFNAL